MERIPKFLINSRQEGDNVADRIAHEMYGSEEGRNLKNQINSVFSNKDLLELQSDLPQVKEFIQSIDFPSWKDESLFEEGKKVFEKYTVEILAILGVYSLPYCYAAANGARVLIHSRKIMSEPERRLGETAQFVTEIFEEGAFNPDGKGFVAIAKVRLMHAVARFFASRHIKDEIPVNQEDMAGTNLAFSLICIRGLEKIGIELTPQQKKGYIHYWNVVGAMLGIKRELLFDEISGTSYLERMIRKHQFRKSQEGIALTESLLKSFNKRNELSELVDAESIMYYFLGKEVGACLGLEKSNPLVNSAISTLSVINFLTIYGKSRLKKSVSLVNEQLNQLPSNASFSV